MDFPAFDLHQLTLFAVLGHITQSGKTNLFARYSRIDLMPFAFDLHQLTLFAVLGHKKTPLLCFLYNTIEAKIRGPTLICNNLTTATFTGSIKPWPSNGAYRHSLLDSAMKFRSDHNLFSKYWISPSPALFNSLLIVLSSS